MESIKVKSEISRDIYVEVNFSVFFRKWLVWFIYLLFIVAIYQLLSTKNKTWADDYVFADYYIIFIGIAMPVFIYISTSRVYSKNKAMGEKKEYTFTEDKFDCVGETTTITSTWANFVRVTERNFYFLLYPNKRTIHFIAKSGFASKDDMEEFRQLIIRKGLKHNFKK